MDLKNEIEKLKIELINKYMKNDIYNKTFKDVEKDLKEKNRLFKKPTNSNIILKIIDYIYNDLKEYTSNNYYTTNIKTLNLKIELYSKIKTKAMKANVNKDGIAGGVIGGVIGSIFGFAGAIAGALAGGALTNNSLDKDKFDNTLKECINDYLNYIYDANYKDDVIYTYKKDNNTNYSYNDDTSNFDEYYDEYMSNKTEDE